MNEVTHTSQSDHITVTVTLSDLKGWAEAQGFEPGMSDQPFRAIDGDLELTAEYLAKVIDLAVSGGPLVGMFLDILRESLMRDADTYKMYVDRMIQGQSPQQMIYAYIAARRQRR